MNFEIRHTYLICLYFYCIPFIECFVMNSFNLINHGNFQIANNNEWLIISSISSSNLLSIYIKRMLFTCSIMYWYCMLWFMSKKSWYSFTLWRGNRMYNKWNMSSGKRIKCCILFLDSKIIRVDCYNVLKLIFWYCIFLKVCT